MALNFPSPIPKLRSVAPSYSALQDDMDVYQQLWNDVANNPNDPEAVWTLTKILADEKGRDFVLDLEREEAILCMELSDRVSCDPHLPLRVAASYCSSGHDKTQPQIRREAGFLRHVEEAR